MKYLIVLLIPLLCHTIVLGQQEEYGEGYIVTTSGDTLRGMVRDRKFGFNNELLDKLTVKLENGKTRKIRKKHISAYQRDNELYVRTILVERILGFRTETAHFLINETVGKIFLYRLVYTDYDNHDLDYVFFIRYASDEHFKRMPLIGWKGVLRKAFAYERDFVEMLDNGNYRYYDIPKVVKAGNEMFSK
ncbi:MAG: hypothetical protein WBA74_05815 [Cyclobacteriaceae bacterium]